MSKFCIKCGTPLNPNGKFCPKCGAKVEETPYVPKSSNNKKGLKPWQIALIVSGGVVLALIIIIVVASSSCSNNKNDSNNTVGSIEDFYPTSTTTAVETFDLETTTTAATTATTTATTIATTAEEKESYLSSTLNGQSYTSYDGGTYIYKVDISNNKFVVAGLFKSSDDAYVLWSGGSSTDQKGEYSFNITSSTEYFAYDGDENKNYYTQDEFISICKLFNGLGLILHVKGNTLISARLAS